MMINKDNYEALLIDYLDGTLNAAQEAALWLFLEENPGIKEEFEGVAEVTLTPPLASFGPKNKLRQPHEVPTDRDHLLAQYLEGQLSPEAGAEVFRKITQDPEWKQAWAYMKQTRLKATEEQLPSQDPLLFAAPLTSQEEHILAAVDAPAQPGESREITQLRALTLKPDEALVYPNQRSLKRTPILTLAVRWTAGIAAAVVLALAVSPLVNNPSQSAQLAHRQAASAFSVEYPAQAANEHASEAQEVSPENPFEAPVHVASGISTPTPRTAIAMQHARNVKPAPLGRGVHSPSPALAMTAESQAELPKMDALVNGTLEEPKYLTATEYLTEQVKTRLWGNKEYPKENYVLALAEKTTEKLAKRDILDVQPKAEEGQKSGFRLQLGKLQIERNRGE